MSRMQRNPLIAVEMPEWKREKFLIAPQIHAASIQAVNRARYSWQY